MFKRFLYLLLLTPALLLAQVPKVTVVTRASQTDPLTFEQVDGNFTALQSAANASLRAWGQKESTTTGLVFGFYGGPAFNGSAWTVATDGVVSLTASATNHVERTVAGAVSANTTGWTAGRIPMAIITTGVSTITAVTDSRSMVDAALVGFNPALATPPPPNSLAAFISTYHAPTANGLNQFVGAGAGNTTLSPAGGAATLASQNTGLGAGTLGALTTGFENTAVGVAALTATTTGNRNTAVGVAALASNTTGDHNVAYGQNALLSNTTGQYNTALGIDALHDNVGGYYNIAMGQNALLSNTGGYYNTALGVDALKANLTGYNNTAVGNGALYRVNSGFYNTALGLYALQNVTNHVANTAVGQWAGYTNDGNYNVFLGYQAGYYETGSNTLIIDNQQRTNEADGRAKALIYGLFGATPAAQRLSLNANVGFGGIKRTLAKVAADNAGSGAYTYPADTEYVYLTSPNTTATTITLPATNGSNPIDGAELVLVSGSSITTVTWAAGAGGATIVGGPAAMTANIPVRMIYHAAGGKWYPR